MGLKRSTAQYQTGLAVFMFNLDYDGRRSRESVCASGRPLIFQAMLDIRLIREQPDFVKSRLATRGGDDAAKIDEVLRVDVERRKAETALQQCNADRKRLSKEIGGKRAKGETTDEIETRVREIGNEIARLSEQSAAFDEQQKTLLLGIPNLPHESVPVGKEASDNPVVRVWGEKPNLSGALDHVALGAKLKLFDLERAAKLSGSGFICFTGAGARLERALIQFMLDLHTREHGYLEMSPPFLVRRDSMIGTSQLPKFEDDMYGLEEQQVFLAPTAEVPVTNFHREEILAAAELPKKFAAYTPCFRREAGSAGRETRGIIRVHQFDKVELVKITTPEESYAEHESLTANAERVLQLLGLHYRAIELCTGDLGFGSAKTYDLEVWSPGQSAYLEVSSCSNFEDFQARRMNLRFKDAEGKNRFCHTLNGSGLALPRLFAALIETYQRSDGSVGVPEKLQSYLGAAEIR
jgi:seryl-tRNA synthetase